MDPGFNGMGFFLNFSKELENSRFNLVGESFLFQKHLPVWLFVLKRFFFFLEIARPLAVRRVHGAPTSSIALQTEERCCFAKTWIIDESQILLTCASRKRSIGNANSLVPWWVHFPPNTHSQKIPTPNMWAQKSCHHSMDTEHNSHQPTVYFAPPPQLLMLKFWSERCAR